MIVKLLTQHHLEFLSLKGGCRGSPESTLVKMSNCWKSHVTAHYFLLTGLVGDWKTQFTVAQDAQFDKFYADTMGDLNIPFKYEL